MIPIDSKKSQNHKSHDHIKVAISIPLPKIHYANIIIFYILIMYYLIINFSSCRKNVWEVLNVTV